MYYRSQRLSDIRGNNLILYFVTRYKGDQQILTQYRKLFLEIQLMQNSNEAALLVSPIVVHPPQSKAQSHYDD